MNKLFQLLLLLSFFSTKISAQTDKEWTLFVFIVGTDIVQDAIADLGEMKAAGNTDNINIVALVGGADLDGWRMPNSFTLVDGEEIPQPFVPSSDIMPTASNITEFLDWGVDNYPAEKYMMLFYNHGMDIRGFGWDNTTNMNLTIGDIQDGIGNSAFIQDGNKFEIIGFDACLMACFEAQSAFRDFGNYYIASEETEPYHAWNWTPVITAMNGMSGLNGEDLGKIIVDTYLEHSEDEGTKHITLSVSDLSKITALETALNDLFGDIDEESEIENFIKARAMSEEYSKNATEPEKSEDMVDIGDILEHFKDLEPTLSTKIDMALDKLREAIVYERSDATRPQAQGMSMYVPLNDLADAEELDLLLELDYDPIDFSSTIRAFVIDRYTPLLKADNDPNTGSIDDGFGFTANDEANRSPLGELYGAIKVDAGNDDLHQIQVVLLEEITDNPDEFIMLGSTYPDTSVVNGDGTVTYAYMWDEEWLSLNGLPAYISDIQFFEVEDGDDFTRVLIPAVLNPNTADEKNIHFSFTFDEAFNHKLEEIFRDPNEEGIPSKERIDLQAGDKIQLKYELFDALTPDATFFVDENNTIEIDNGNDDLLLDHSMLLPGKYHLGFVLMDHAHNDTIIIDPRVREVMSVGTNDLEKNIEITLSPNPSVDEIIISFAEAGKADIKLYDHQGRMVLSQKSEQAKTSQINVATFPAGTYFLHVTLGGESIVKQLVKP